MVFSKTSPKTLVEAVQQVFEALEPFDEAARQRILSSAVSLLGGALPGASFALRIPAHRMPWRLSHLDPLGSVRFHRLSCFNRSNPRRTLSESRYSPTIARRLRVLRDLQKMTLDRTSRKHGSLHRKISIAIIASP